MGMNPTYRNIINDECVLLSRRNAVAQVTFDATDIATYDWITHSENATVGALQITYGTVAGGIWQLDSPNVQLQLQGRNYAPDPNDIAVHTGQLRLIPTGAGNNEVVVTTM